MQGPRTIMPHPFVNYQTISANMDYAQMSQHPLTNLVVSNPSAVSSDDIQVHKSCSLVKCLRNCNQNSSTCSCTCRRSAGGHWKSCSAAGDSNGGLELSSSLSVQDLFTQNGYGCDLHEMRPGSAEERRFRSKVRLDVNNEDVCPDNSGNCSIEVKRIVKPVDIFESEIYDRTRVSADAMLDSDCNGEQSVVDGNEEDEELKPGDDDDDDEVENTEDAGHDDGDSTQEGGEQKKFSKSYWRKQRRLRLKERLLAEKLLMESNPDLAAEEKESLRPQKGVKSKDIFDKWWFNVIFQHKTEYVNLWLLVKKLLLLSHGQATVERGFSFIKEMAADNLSQETLRARRLVLDHIRNAGQIFGVNIDKQMLLSTSSAWKRCDRFLTDQRKSAQTSEKQMKRKILDEEIQSLKKKRKTAEDDARQLNIEDDRLSLKAQEQRCFTLLERANTRRLSSKDKQDQVIILTSKLYEKEEEQNMY